MRLRGTGTQITWPPSEYRRRALCPSRRWPTYRCHAQKKFSYARKGLTELTPLARDGRWCLIWARRRRGAGAFQYDGTVSFVCRAGRVMRVATGYGCRLSHIADSSVGVGLSLAAPTISWLMSASCHHAKTTFKRYVTALRVVFAPILPHYQSASHQ